MDYRNFITLKKTSALSDAWTGVNAEDGHGEQILNPDVQQTELPAYGPGQEGLHNSMEMGLRDYRANGELDQREFASPEEEQNYYLGLMSGEEEAAMNDSYYGEPKNLDRGSDFYLQASWTGYTKQANKRPNDDDFMKRLKRISRG